MAVTADWANSTAAATGTGPNVTVSKPAGTSAGQVLFLGVLAYDNASVTASPNGWTPTDTFTVVRESTTEIVNFFGFTRILTGAEGASFQTDLSASALYRGAFCVAVAGAHASTPVDTTNTTVHGRAATQTLGGLTTSFDGDLLIGVKVGYYQAVTVDPSNWTSKGAYDTVIEFYERTVTSAGVVADQTLTVGAADGYVSFTVAFTDRVASGGGSPVVPPAASPNLRAQSLGALGLRVR